MKARQPIRYWNRAKERPEEEKVYGEGALRWLYGTAPGRWLAVLLAMPWVSRIVGLYQSSPLSRWRIRSFIEEFDIPMDEFEVVSYHSFNDFFSRRFRAGARTFCESPDELPAFAEGRYLAWDRLEPGQTTPVKGDELAPAALLGSEEEAGAFDGGPVFIARLCPVDYHRFHFPDAGTVARSYRLPGRLHSVNPFALRSRPGIFATNDRRVSILETRNFGRLAYIEVGAMNVGRIVATHPAGEPFERGDEKGYFLFGGSTVIVLGEEGHWTPAADLRERTAQGQETFVRLGECIATK